MLTRLTGIVKALCLAYVLWLPVSQGNILYPVLAILTAVSLLDAVRHRVRVSPMMLSGFLLFLVAVVYGLAVGAVRDALGLEHQATVWIGSAIIWSSWALGMRKEQIRTTVWVLVLVIGASSLSMVVYIGGQVGIIPDLIPAALMETQGAGFDDSRGDTAIRFLGLSTLAAGGPLLVAFALSPRVQEFAPPRWIVIAAAVAAVLAASFAGRRAILAVVVIAPLVLILSRGLLQGFSLRRILRHRALPLVIAVVLSGAVLILWLPRILTGQLVSLGRDALASFFGIGDAQKVRDPENRTRVELGQELLDGWSELPFLGAGTGATLPSGYVRSVERPWMFELQYHVWLFNGGVVGVTVLLAACTLLLLSLRTIVRSATAATRDLLACAFTAALCLLIANASNPYLQAVGHWWGVALVFAIAMAMNRATEPEPTTTVSATSFVPSAQRGSGGAG